MRFKNLRLLGIAHLEAEVIVTSKAISDELLPFVGKYLPPEQATSSFIEQLTGIKERRSWATHNLSPSEASIRVANKVLQSVGLDASEIGLLVNTSITKDYIEPSVSSLVHGGLGLNESCRSFDLSNACVGFVDAIDIAGLMVDQKKVRFALITSGENNNLFMEGAMKKFQSSNLSETDFRLWLANLTLGSGAVAAILCHADEALGVASIQASTTLSDTANGHSRLGISQRDGIITDGSELLKAGVNLAVRTLEKFESEHALDREIFSRVVCHQVSRSNNHKVLSALNIPYVKAPETFPNFGNMGTVSVPFTLSKSISEHKPSSSEKILLTGIGSGLNCTFMSLQF